MSVTAVVQFGLAMMPLCRFTSAALISGITSGTAASIRNALELSMTMQPFFAAMGAKSLEMPAPALNNAMSMPLKESLVSSLTVMSCPRNLSFFPTERADASNVNFPTGKLRFSSVLIISMPTAPVAPTTATCGLRFIKGGNYNVWLTSVKLDLLVLKATRQRNHKEFSKVVPYGNCSSRKNLPEKASKGTVRASAPLEFVNRATRDH